MTIGSTCAASEEANQDARVTVKATKLVNRIFGGWVIAVDRCTEMAEAY